MNKISIVIPVYNEEEGLKSILPKLVHQTQLKRPKVEEIIIVDDSSTDETANICSNYPESVVLITRPKLMGLGSAVREGVKHAKSEFIMVMDGDGQHLPEQAIRLTKSHTKDSSKHEILIGSRFAKYEGYCDSDTLIGLSIPRKILSRTMTRILNIVPGAKASTDPLTGMFLCHRDYILNTKTNGYKILLEILVHNKSAPVKEMPITLSHRKGGKSKANIKEIFKVLKICLF